MDIFDPLVGMGRGVSSTELGERTRGASFVDELFTPFSGKLQNSFEVVGFLRPKLRQVSSFVELFVAPHAHSTFNRTSCRRYVVGLKARILQESVVY